jgi:glyoxylase-like metal-dependent hydrolase (beta-lactamase superfamily II)
MAWKGLGVSRFRFEKGLHDLGRGVYAWLQPDGSWGWSNAGLVVDGDQSLLVDTLFDLPLTHEMLAAMRDAEPRAAGRIDTLVNTHANGDHCHGNQLVAGAEIVASRACAEEMAEFPPGRLADLMKAYEGQDSAVSRFVQRAFGPFDFSGIDPTPPTLTFEGTLTRRVGDKTVELLEVGPAHTRGDVLAYVPADGVVFTGDILFVEGTPIVWAGPVENWIRACSRILALGVELVVPGHGPISDHRGVEAVQAYLEYVRARARERFDAGMGVLEAARDIPLGDFADWSDSERIVVNVDTLYREFSGDSTAPDLPQLLAGMAELAGS